MTIHNISIRSIEKDIIVNEISLKLKIQRERLTIETTIENKKLEETNNIESDKNYCIVFNDEYLDKILYKISIIINMFYYHKILYILKMNQILTLNF